MHYLYTDGASRENPGKSGGGAVLYDEDMNEIKTSSKYYNIKTNNESEYLALTYCFKLEYCFNSIG